MLHASVIGASLVIFAASASAQALQERPVNAAGFSINKLRQTSSDGATIDLETRLRDATLNRRPELIDSNVRSISNGNFAAYGSLKRFEGNQQVIPGGEKSGSQGDAFNQIGKKALPDLPSTKLSTLATQLKVNGLTSCSREIVIGLENAQGQVRNVPVDSINFPPEDRLYRFLHKLPGFQAETENSIRALQLLASAWRSILANCFTTPTDQPLFSKLAGRIGAFSKPESAPFCSGTILEDGKVLTARHCFVDKNNVTRNLQDITFTLGDGSDVLNVTELEVTPLNTIGFNISIDWIIVGVSKQGKNLPKFSAAKKLISVSEAIVSNQKPTPLEIFSLVPLAKTLDPIRYPTSIVGYKLPGCFVAFKKEHCVTHMCNAVPGGSGASLFAPTDSDPLWVGIHIGAETPNGGSCSNTHASTNMALRGNAQINKYFTEQ